MAFYNNGITGHRGNPVDFPENTLVSFGDAVAAGVDWIELDLRLSKDGKLIVIHDPNTGRTCDTDISVSETESCELRKLNAGSGYNQQFPDKPFFSEKLPYLEEVLELVGQQDKTRVSIQPKVDCVSAVCKLIKSMNLTASTGFNDGDLALLCKAKNLLPETTIFYDINSANQLAPAIDAAMAYDFDGIVLYYTEMTQEHADRINVAGLESGVWTVNDPDDFLRLRDIGVKRFYTDCPRKFIKLSGAKIHEK